MNRISLIAALAVFAAASAHAQVQRIDPAVPSALPDSRVEPARELGSTAPRELGTIAPREVGSIAPPELVMDRRRGGSDADARHCLELPTNRQVHRCAERYRSRAARARTMAKAPKAAPAPAKTAELVKPPIDAPKPGGAPRPSDVAKAADLVKPMDVTKPSGTPKAVETAPKAAAPGTATPAPAAKASPTDAGKAPPAKAAESTKK